MFLYVKMWDFVSDCPGRGRLTEMTELLRGYGVHPTGVCHTEPRPGAVVPGLVARTCRKAGLALPGGRPDRRGPPRT